ncbi:Fe-S cluster assembly scaffold SufA [Oceaniserpentilla sp. 4NH20-0058]|uniref:HesB/IscA family protein n=1 Tax=Oceaniserpentilla sp. 4NH20-0058 TaxID=3127660 RepID=UPI00310677BD
MSDVNTFSPNDITVSMTEKAIAYARKQLKSSTDAKGIVLGVKKSGCSGFKYDLQLLEVVTGNERSFQVADDVILYVTAEALPYVNGTEIDYTTEGLNSTMKFNNPNAKDECGCGESFNI